MLASVDRQTAIRLLDEEHNAVRELIDELADEEITRPDTIRHGLYAGQHCSFKDLLAHLTTYEVYALEALRAWRDGEKHWIIDAMRDPARSREIHFGGIEERKPYSLNQMLDEWDKIQAALRNAFENMPDDEWRSPAPYPADDPTDLGGMLESILVAPPRPMYRHLPVHIPDSEAYIRSLRGG